MDSLGDDALAAVLGAATDAATVASAACASTSLRRVARERDAAWAGAAAARWGGSAGGPHTATAPPPSRSICETQAGLAPGAPWWGADVTWPADCVNGLSLIDAHAWTGAGSGLCLAVAADGGLDVWPVPAPPGERPPALPVASTPPDSDGLAAFTLTAVPAACADPFTVAARGPLLAAGRADGSLALYRVRGLASDGGGGATASSDDDDDGDWLGPRGSGPRGLALTARLRARTVPLGAPTAAAWLGLSPGSGCLVALHDWAAADAGHATATRRVGWATRNWLAAWDVGAAASPTIVAEGAVGEGAELVGMAPLGGGGPAHLAGLAVPVPPRRGGKAWWDGGCGAAACALPSLCTHRLAGASPGPPPIASLALFDLRATRCGASGAVVSASIALARAGGLADVPAAAFPRLATDGGSRGGLWAFTSHPGTPAAAWDVRALGRGPVWKWEDGQAAPPLWLECGPDGRALFGRAAGGSGVAAWDLSAGPFAGSRPPTAWVGALGPAPAAAPLPLMAAAPPGPGSAWSGAGRVVLVGVVGRAGRRSSPVRAPEEAGEDGRSTAVEVVRVCGPVAWGAGQA